MSNHTHVGDIRLSTEGRANETEAWGVTYERYSLERKLRQLTRKYAIHDVAEMPAHGAKAMPSIYSIGFGLAGARVTLVNGVAEYEWCWNKVGLGGMVRFVHAESLYDTQIPGNSFDFVWNFAYLPLEANRDILVEEMKRISEKYVAFFSVNHGNIGFHVHRSLHKVLNVPWTHGDVDFNKQHKIANLLTAHGLRIVELGFVDCPIWPDSIGFRDMRLHRQEISFDGIHWESPYVDNLISGRFPLWVEIVYTWERIPNLSSIKTMYSHINYVIGRKI